MNIILVSNKMAKAKTLNAWQAGLAITGLIVLPVILTLLLITPKQTIKEQGVKALFPAHVKGSIVSSQRHLNAYAKQIGELQARIMRLDAQNQRLVKMAGEKTPQDKTPLPASIETFAAESRGGPLVRSYPMSEAELMAAIEKLIEAVDARDEYQGIIEAKVLQLSVLKDMLPNFVPVLAGYNSSSYGWRIDPFTGYKAFHEGLDFPASIGTPILAAADGIVTATERGADYGNMVKISHGSGLETRYAHASKMLVKEGERVVKGQMIARVGNTGRSTGPHLHYEIRLNGNALDPRQYLRNNAG